jgi:uncharacterized lipoprotein
MRSKLASWVMAVSAVGALAGCGRQEATRDLADELDKVLDPAPQYVDKPAEEPRDPR